MSTGMIVHRSINRESVCKANTGGDTSGNCFVFSYEITFRYFNIAPCVTNKNNARMRHVTDKESYFENFLHVVRRISTETRRKPMSVWYFLEYLATYKTAEAVVRTCSVKKEFLKFCKIHKKTPVPESTLLKKRLWPKCFPVNFENF